jgi:hypothetical protein
MKKTLLTVASFLIATIFLSINATSQSLEIYYQEMVDNGSSEIPIKFYAGIQNNTSEQQEIKIDFNMIEFVEGHSIECCAGILCFPPKSENFTLDFLPPIPPNGSTEPNFLEAKLLHNGIKGVSKVEIVFYLSNDPEDKVSVLVEYRVGDDEKSLEIYNQEIVENGSKTEPIIFYAGIANNTNETKNIEIGVEPKKLVSGHSLECCAGILCYPPRIEKFVLNSLPPIPANSKTDNRFLEAILIMVM